MQSIKLVMLLAFVSVAHAQLRVGMPKQAGRQVPYGMRAPQGSSRVAQPFYKPQQRPSPFITRAEQQAPSNLGPMEGSELGFPDIKDTGEKKKAPGPGNVYGEEQAACGKIGECAWSESAPTICVGLKERVREGSDSIVGADATSFRLSKPMNLQSAWSDNYVLECIPIWDFVEDTADSLKAWLTYGNHDLVPKCDALPAAALNSEYSVSMWNACELEAREYKYVSPASSKYAADSSEVSKNNLFKVEKPSLGEKPEKMMSQKCERFRKVIKGICVGCELQTSKGSAKAALSSMCDGVQTAMSAEAPLDVMSVGAAVMFGFFVGFAAVIVKLRRSASTAAKEPLLEASS